MTNHQHVKSIVFCLFVAGSVLLVVITVVVCFLLELEGRDGPLYGGSPSQQSEHFTNALFSSITQAHCPLSFR